jgi:hypothetical protein
MDISAETDVAQLLLNMLAGVAVSFRLNNGPECCYLSETGCIFRFKPMFCLNYICDRIVSYEQRANLRILEERTGALLRAQQGLEILLIDFFKRRMPTVGEESVE